MKVFFHNLDYIYCNQNIIYIFWLECDLKFSTNKLVSLKHCQIEQKETDKEIQAWLVDLNSSNGCIINLTDKIKNNVKIIFLI